MVPFPLALRIEEGRRARRGVKVLRKEDPKLPKLLSGTHVPPKSPKVLALFSPLTS